MNNNKFFHNGVQLTINTDTPLEPEHVSQVLTHLYNKVEVLRLCLRQRDNQWWYCTMPKPALDFEVVNGPDSFMEGEAMVNTPFNLSEGPLWQVRLMPLSSDYPCLWPEVKEKFPYQNKVLFNFHHGIVDGPDLLSITGLFTKLLEDYISKIPIDKQQFGQLVDHSHTSKIVQQMTEELEKDPQKLKLMLNELKNRKHTPLLVEAFGTPSSPPNISTENLQYAVLDFSEVNKFNEECKARKITFNSGFIGLVNTALVELVREAGIIRDIYNISSLHSIDLRRYMKGYSEVYPMGFHTLSISHTMATPYNVKDIFWEYATQFDTEFRSNLKNKQILRDFALRKMTLPDTCNLDHLYATPSPPKYDYIFTNMFLPRFFNYGVGRRVQQTEIKYYVPLNASDFVFFTGICNIREKVEFDMFYSPYCINSDTAQMCHDKVVSVFREIINS
ncbi:uncharacterized protein [Cherax quadricarinatus]